ncbi:hypothetical protein MUK42_16665, partial [Musa troglodytarum]
RKKRQHGISPLKSLPRPCLRVGGTCREEWFLPLDPRTPPGSRFSHPKVYSRFLLPQAKQAFPEPPLAPRSDRSLYLPSSAVHPLSRATFPELQMLVIFI